MENVILIGATTPSQGDVESLEYLKELEFLANTAGGYVLKVFRQKIEKIHYKTFLGKGKILQINDYIQQNAIDTAIFDDELTPSQQKNLENILNCKIVDRTNLILSIFALRAKTAMSKIQVELAQYQYLLPRLTNLWTHLSKQKGGIGMRGPGEKEIETDRRIIRQQISLLKKKLIKIDRQMTTQRKGRDQLIRVSLVGYTNAGKSTIMNLLSKSNVFAEDKLFATLDTTVRKVVIGNLPFLLTDTVGFIRKLPHQLVESFKSTLDEVREADLMIHLVDISNPNFEDHINTVNRTIVEIGVSDKPKILVFNKIDAYTFVEKEDDDLTPKTRENVTLKDLQKTWMSKIEGDVLFISALNKLHFDDLKDQMYNTIKQLHQQRYPYNNFLY